MRTPIILLCGIIGIHPLAAQTHEPRSWLTDYELSGRAETPRYDRTIAYCQRLAHASPVVWYTTFGTSPQGRDLPLVVVSRDRAFTPGQAHRTGKPIVLIQSGIHAGEIDGKDASLMLVREMAITKSLGPLLDHVILLFVPIFNVDGHERFGPFNRINQNGPKEMGWRVTAQNLNLNRDYMKADAPEMRAMLRLFTEWLPDLYIDCHVTDGIDFQYDVTYAAETGPEIEPVLSEWITRVLMPGVITKVEFSGHKIFTYVFPREDIDLSKGINGGASTPRFSTGYAALENRPAILIETHMLKPYSTRVDATYHLLKAIIEEVNDRPQLLQSAVRRADSVTVAAGTLPGSTFPLSFGLSETRTSQVFLGITSRPISGTISGVLYPGYTGVPIELTIPSYTDIIVKDSAAIPFGYLVPPEWLQVHDVLLAHGIAVQRLVGPETLDVESYRFSAVKFRDRPYEGRQVATFTTELKRERRVYPAGSFFIPTDQRAAKVAMALLEPRGPDSFVSWGFFNAIFEQKEYAEIYVMEKIGVRLFEDNPALRREFEERLKADTAFARNPSARINWVYQRSPWGDPSMNSYPVGRITSPVALKLTKQ